MKYGRNIKWLKVASLLYLNLNFKVLLTENKNKINPLLMDHTAMQQRIYTKISWKKINFFNIFYCPNQCFCYKMSINEAAEKTCR